MLALKIYDVDDSGRTYEMLSRVKGGDFGVELATYGRNGFPEYSMELFSVDRKRKVLHLPCKIYNLIDFGGEMGGASLEKKRALMSDLMFMRNHQIEGGAVIHVVGEGESMPPRMAALAALGVADAMPAGVPLFVENTYESLGWFKSFFDCLSHEEAKRIGFCLDVGHTRVWERTRLSFWTDFCEELIGRGHPLHVHAHLNDGLSDEHLPISLMDEARISLGDDGWCPHGILPELIRIRWLVSGSGLFVLENEMSLSLETLDWAEKKLNGGMIWENH